jgi:hypothetical protein
MAEGRCHHQTQAHTPALTNTKATRTLVPRADTGVHATELTHQGGIQEPLVLKERRLDEPCIVQNQQHVGTGVREEVSGPPTSRTPRHWCLGEELRVTHRFVPTRAICGVVLDVCVTHAGKVDMRTTGCGQLDKHAGRRLPGSFGRKHA